MTASFREVLSPAWAFWRAALDTCVGLVVGTLYAFLAILVIGIVGEEALASLYGRIDLDPLFRASMGVILMVGAILALVVPLVMVAERTAALHAVRSAMTAEPDAVPQRVLREELSAAPSSYLRLTGLIVFWCVAGLGGIFALGVLFTDDLREDPISWIVLAGMAVLAIGAELLRRAGAARVERETGELVELRRRWASLVLRATSAEAQRRDAAPERVVPTWLVTPGARILSRIAMVLLAATVVALTAFMLSVFMRQQCRTCDPVYWDEPIENGIDVLSLGSGVAIGLCALLAAIAWIGGVLLQFAREIALARWAADGAPRRVDPVPLRPLLTENRALVRLQLGLSTVGTGGVIIGVGALWAEWERLDPAMTLLLAAGAIGLGLILGWADAPRSRRERQLIRAATLPGDVGRAGAEKRAARSARARRR